MDRLLIKDIRVFAHHGVLPSERDRGQHFYIDLELELDLGGAASSDELSDTLDYVKVASSVSRLATYERYQLIETLAEKIAEQVLSFEPVARVTVTVRKPEVTMPVRVEWVGISITRERGTPGPPGGGSA